MTLFDDERGGSFVRSRDKFEAVNRLAALTGTGPEDLGPGSKERKRVLVNVIEHLGLGIDTSLSKTRIGRAIAEALGGRWTDACWSSGETITLVGLDLILELAIRSSDAVLLPPPRDAASEARLIVEAAAEATARRLEMVACVNEMRAAENSNWAQTEWVGFYFEAVARARCQSVLGGEPGRLYGRTRFDYRWANTWDFKAHTEVDRRGRSGRDLVLNDIEAIRACLGDGGLGFIVLHGRAEFDESGELRTWHVSERAATGRKARRTDTGRPSRVYKAAFEPRIIEALYLTDVAEVETALDEGWLVVMNQGRQIGGQPRKPKFMLRRAHVPPQSVLSSIHLT